jgi:competence protein ComFC
VRSAVSVAAALEQLLLPAECLLCHALLGAGERDRLICAVCRHRWRAVRPPWCERCGQPAPHFGPCRLCAAWPEALHRVRTAVWLEDGARRAVHALKYDGLSRVAHDLAAAMLPLRPHTDAPSGGALVPIPLAPRRLRQRGYNQAESLARALARVWKMPVCNVLTRSRETPTQTALTPETRLANVAGAFGLRIDDCGLRIGNHPIKSAIRNPQCTIVLVDDVFTTGATLAEAARALAQAGATRIHGITFARAAIPDFT